MSNKWKEPKYPDVVWIEPAKKGCVNTWSYTPYTHTNDFSKYIRADLVPQWISVDKCEPEQGELVGIQFYSKNGDINVTFCHWHPHDKEYVIRIFRLPPPHQLK